MGNWSVQQEAKKEVKEKDKVRREKLAGFFFNLAQLTFACRLGCQPRELLLVQG